MSIVGSGYPSNKVSVAMVTYNHEQFIAQAIESVLMQQTEFDYELVIGEDCSTDGTREIVFEYAQKYPSRIRFLLSEHNLGMIHNFVATLNACCGQYIALLDGDDYWTDPHKLQKQVEFLDAHPDHSACFHRIYRLIHSTGEMEIWKFQHQPTRPSYSLDDVIRGSHYIRTASIMYRRELVPKLPTWFYDVSVGDWPLFVLIAQHGMIGFIDEAMSVYRIHDRGVWSGTVKANRYKMLMEPLEKVGTYLGPKYEKAIRHKASDRLLSLASLSADDGDLDEARVYFLRSIMEYPICLDMLILDKLVLLCRLYFPLLYRALKRI